MAEERQINIATFDKTVQLDSYKFELKRLLENFKFLYGTAYILGAVQAVSSVKDIAIKYTPDGEEPKYVNKLFLKNAYEGLSERILDTVDSLLEVSKKRKTMDTDLQTPNFVIQKFRDFVQNAAMVFESAYPGLPSTREDYLVNKLDFVNAEKDTDAIVGTNTMSKLIHLYIKLAKLTDYYDTSSYYMDENLYELGTDVSIPNENGSLTPVSSLFDTFPATASFLGRGEGLTNLVVGTPQYNPDAPVKVIAIYGDGVDRVYYGGGRYYNHLEQPVSAPSGANPQRWSYKLTIASVTQLINKIQYKKAAGAAVVGGEANFETIKEELKIDAQRDYVAVNDAAAIYAKVLKVYDDNIKATMKKAAPDSKVSKLRIGSSTTADMIAEREKAIDRLKEVPRPQPSSLVLDTLDRKSRRRSPRLDDDDEEE